MSERNIVGQLSAYYKETMKAIVDDEISEEEIRLAVVANFVNAYMSSIYQNIYEANTREERMAAVFVLEMMSNIQEDFSTLTEDMTVEAKSSKMIQVLTNLRTPSYENVRSESVQIKLIDAAKSDFNSMAEFLAG